LKMNLLLFIQISESLKVAVTGLTYLGAFSFYIGARDEARDLALALASACSLTSARS